MTVSGIFGTSGALTVTGIGSELLATGQLGVGVGGDASVLIQNQATAITGGNTANALAGLDIGQFGVAPGNGLARSGAVTVSNALLSNTGRFIVGDAGIGSLSVITAGTVTTTGAATIAAATGSDGSSVSVTGPGHRCRLRGR